MITEHAQQSARIAAAMDTLQETIRSHYPAATFSLLQGEDPEGTYLQVTVDVEDTDEVVDIFIDRLLQLQIDEGLPVYVIPVRPLERIMALLQRCSH